MTRTHLWIDASAGIAGDMLLGALHDAGADLGHIQAAVDAVVPGAIRISAASVRRAGLRACKVSVSPLVDDPPHRSWRDIRALLESAALAPSAASLALAVFARLAAAEATVHGIPAGDVHFHEVGALDAIADVVGVCAALTDLGAAGGTDLGAGLAAATVSAGEIAVGSGSVRAAHGRLPVPAPAVAELGRGWRIRSGGQGELATPTGVALLRTLATTCEDLPSMTLSAVGVGAGTRDTPDHPNVVRVFLGTRGAASSPTPSSAAVILEANVDDLDPRLWPGVIAGLLEAGASDAWLVPIVMKKGRPAHTLTALCPPDAAAAVRDRIFRDTSTLGVRSSPRDKNTLARTFVQVAVDDIPVTVKIGHRDGVILQAMPEFDEVAALARALDIPERVALTRATAAASSTGLTAGGPWPPPNPVG